MGAGRSKNIKTIAALASVNDPAKVTRGVLENTAPIAAEVLMIEVLVAGSSKG